MGTILAPRQLGYVLEEMGRILAPLSSRLCLGGDGYNPSPSSARLCLGGDGYNPSPSSARLCLGEEMSTILAPSSAGLWFENGAEPAVHVTRVFLLDKVDNLVLLKLEFKNVLNCTWRHKMVPSSAGLWFENGAESAVHVTRVFLLDKVDNLVLLKLEFKNVLNCTWRHKMVKAVDDLTPIILSLLPLPIALSVCAAGRPFQSPVVLSHRLGTSFEVQLSPFSTWTMEPWKRALH